MIALFSALFATLAALVVTALVAALLWGLNKQLGAAWVSRGRDLRSLLPLAQAVVAVVALLAVVAGVWTVAALLWSLAFA